MMAANSNQSLAQSDPALQTQLLNIMDFQQQSHLVSCPKQLLSQPGYALQRSRSQQASSKRGRSNSRDRSASRTKHARTNSRRRSSRSPPARTRRGGNTGGRWQDNRGNSNAGKQGSIMGQPPQQNKFQQMRGENQMQLNICT
jgi:hypothetical protein